MEGNVDRYTPIEHNGGEVLVEEGLEEDNLVPVLQKGHEDRVLAWGLRVTSQLNNGMNERNWPSLAPLVMRISVSAFRLRLKSGS